MYAIPGITRAQELVAIAFRHGALRRAQPCFLESSAYIYAKIVATTQQYLLLNFEEMDVFGAPIVVLVLVLTGRGFVASCEFMSGKDVQGVVTITNCAFPLGRYNNRNWSTNSTGTTECLSSR